MQGRALAGQGGQLEGWQSDGTGQTMQTDQHRIQLHTDISHAIGCQRRARGRQVDTLALVLHSVGVRIAAWQVSKVTREG